MASADTSFSPGVVDGGDMSIPLRRDLREADGMFPKQQQETRERVCVQRGEKERTWRNFRECG